MPLRHPQIAALEKRKWDLVAKSASLRDDLEVELIYWKKTSKWVDMGASVARFVGEYRWGVGILGTLVAWVWKKGSFKAAKQKIEGAAEDGKNVVHRLLKISRNVILGWRLFQHAKVVVQGYCAAKQPEA